MLASNLSDYMSNKSLPTNNAISTTNETDDKELLSFLRWIQKIVDCYYKLFIIIFGIIGNSVTIIIFKRTKLAYSKLTSFYLISLAISDIAYLVTLFFIYLNDNTKDYKFISKVDIACKLSIYASYVLNFMSCGLVLAFTVQRLCSICFPFHANHFNIERHSKLIVISLLIFALVVYTFPSYYYGVYLLPNSTTFQCYTPEEDVPKIEKFNFFDTVLTFCIPFFGILIMNGMIIRTLKRSSYNFIIKTSTSNNNPNNNNQNNNPTQKRSGGVDGGCRGASSMASGHGGVLYNMQSVPDAIDTGLGVASDVKRPKSKSLYKSTSRTRSVPMVKYSFRRNTDCQIVQNKSTHRPALNGEYYAMSTMKTSRNRNDDMRCDVSEDIDTNLNKLMRNESVMVPNLSDMTRHRLKVSFRKTNNNSSSGDVSAQRSINSDNGANSETNSINKNLNNNITTNTNNTNNNNNEDDDNSDASNTIHFKINGNLLILSDSGRRTVTKKRRSRRALQKWCHCLPISSLPTKATTDPDDSLSSSYSSTFRGPNYQTVFVSNLKQNKTQHHHHDHQQQQLQQHQQQHHMDSSDTDSLMMQRRAIENESSRDSSARSELTSRKNRVNSILSNNSHSYLRKNKTTRETNKWKSSNRVPLSAKKRCRAEMEHSEGINNSNNSIGTHQTRSSCNERGNVLNRTSFKMGGPKSHSVSRKITKMLIIVSSTFLVLNFPLHAFNVYNHVASIYQVNVSPYVQFTEMLFRNIFFTSFSCNFLLYSISGVTFRTEFKKLLVKLFRRM